MKIKDKSNKKSSNDLPYEDALFQLKVTTSCVYAILDATFSIGVSMLDEKLNHSYISLNYLLNTFLNTPNLKRLKKYRPQFLPDHLLEDIEGLHIWWTEIGNQQMLSFYGAIEKEFVLNGKYIPKFILKVQLDFLNETTELAAKHKKKKEEILQKLLENAAKDREESNKNRKISLAKAKLVDFDPLTSTLIVDDKLITITPSTFEYCFCKLMFDAETREPVEWIDLYEETHAPTTEIDSNWWKQVYDTMKRINKIVKKELNDNQDLFAWKNKMVIRLF